jgi:hypothetical protein
MGVSTVPPLPPATSTVLTLKNPTTVTVPSSEISGTHTLTVRDPMEDPDVLPTATPSLTCAIDGKCTGFVYFWFIPLGLFLLVVGGQIYQLIMGPLKEKEVRQETYEMH